MYAGVGATLGMTMFASAAYIVAHWLWGFSDLDGANKVALSFLAGLSTLLCMVVYAFGEMANRTSSKAPQNSN